MSRYSLTMLVVAAIVVVAVVAQPVIADGSETLGPPSISIASGTDIIAKGTGMLTQPGTIDLNIPAGASVEQVFLCWERFGFSATIGFGENGTLPLAECSCSDFYRITIYDGVNAADIVKNPDRSIDPSQLNRTEVIYRVWGYIDGGNVQIHQLTGFDQQNQ